MQNSRGWRDYLALSGKGMMMGAADAVPGVSGGTIAFMTGIYEELIFSLHQCGPEALKVLLRQGPRQAWQHINGNFLLALFGGVLLALLSFARVVLYLLASYPELLWSFFFGLILASCWLLVKQIQGWSSNAVSAFISGTILAYLITTLAPTTIEATPLSIFLAGMIAICAMILPGISGSFILLLIGMYAPVMGAIKGFDLMFIAIFGAGCVIGLLSFSRVLNWMFQHYHTVTLALLGGFMLGSLNKVWPWKYTTSYVINRHGNEVPLVQENVLPGSYEVMTGQAAFLGGSVAMLLLGMALVVLLERSTRSANG
ncbi:DUF368 domain-containing protein [Marinobacterium jannaschii]|uniref:DUF368 domain-containing protein n=1 Tax=Marinobacterium jannaschii TaxID=64970 RepID=UPI0004814F9E|nr:DUF368 domain-containing protein [Marinobacterium jannaschii]